MNNNQDPVVIPEPDAARGLLFERVYAPLFFGKLAAAYGLEPRTEAEAAALLEMGEKLAAIEQQAKVAAAAANPYGDVLAGLDQAMLQHGIQVPAKVAAAEHAVARMATDIAADPELWNAFLSIKSAEADAAAKTVGYAPAPAAA